MVASRAALEPTPESIVMQLSEQMQSLAEAGEWERIEDIALRIRSAVLNVPEAERRSVLLEVHRSLQQVEAAAIEARQTVTERISELRRGQVAKKAYELR